MWRQWELERGLTMMVSDDALCSQDQGDHLKHQKVKEKRNSNERIKQRNVPIDEMSMGELYRRRNYWMKKLFEVEEGDAERNLSTKWIHQRSITLNHWPDGRQAVNSTHHYTGFVDLFSKVTINPLFLFNVSTSKSSECVQQHYLSNLEPFDPQPGMQPLSHTLLYIIK
ncbi:uncharacterized protein LOC106467431 isoform X2 [Limulus polyphemus]|uniref:Uncharacterized protein LOC106467431 isoform X2 n=1 Tax=Limulus polyphemus TaxID=6850 RepID=A0ABM1T623_LIMPO|nr:uncharacterized protein LOC106467431 isoform X2 [Limulus polyphemus]